MCPLDSVASTSEWACLACGDNALNPEMLRSQKLRNFLVSRFARNVLEDVHGSGRGSGDVTRTVSFWRLWVVRRIRVML
jgi:hypothetical protein